MIDKAALLKSALPEREVDIAGRGAVRVRGLTRAEALRLQHSADPVEAEALAVAAGFVDPALTLEEARQLVAGWSGGEIQPVIDAIMELSGLIEGAQKSGRAGVDDG